MVTTESACLVRTPQQVKHVSGENGLVASALRRPRNREVTSRYKDPPSSSVSPAQVSNRRFPTPHAERLRSVSDTPSSAPTHHRRFPTPSVDRGGSTTDVPSPKRAISSERRRPSPSKTAENTGSRGANGTTSVPPHRTGVCTELLWPSTRSLNMSMQFEPQSLPPSGQAKKQVDIKGKGNCVAADHALKPSPNTVPPARFASSRKPTPERKPTPLRRQNIEQAENARPQENVQKSDQNGRPGSSNGKMEGSALNRSVDFSFDRERPRNRVSSPSVQGKPFHGSTIGSHRISTSGAQPQSIYEGTTTSNASQNTRSESRGRRRDSPLRCSKGANKDSPPKVVSYSGNGATGQLVCPARLVGQAVEPANSEFFASPDNASDTDSVSSGCTTTTSTSGRGTPGSVSVTKGVRGTKVPARVWQDAASKSRHVSENKLRSSMPESELSAAVLAGRLGARNKVVDSPQGSHTRPSGGAPSSPWSMLPNGSLSGSNTPQQPPSPARTSPYRNIPSPLRSRGGPPLALAPRLSSAAVMLKFGGDTKGKKGLSALEEMHLLRILHNRLMQWRFVNAQTEVTLCEQASAAEKLLYNVAARIFDLRSSVVVKKGRMQQARHAGNMNRLLSIQAEDLEEWSALEQEHLNALTGFLQALESAVLRVPVASGVKADPVAVQGAMSSAFDIMNSVESLVAFVLPKADNTNSLVSDLGYVAVQERVLLEECASLLATALALEIEERSLQTHLIQCEHERARVLGHLMDAALAPDAVLV